MPQQVKSYTKQFRATSTKAAGDGSPDTKQLDIINQFTVTEQAVEDLYVRTFNLAHNGIDRDGEIIDEALLVDLQTTLEGKGFFIKHPGGWDGDSAPGEGRIFEAVIITMSLDEARALLKEPNLQFEAGTTQAHIMQASMYMVRTDSNKDLLKKIDAGIAGDVSIGFNSSTTIPVLDGDNHSIANRLMAPGEAFEASLVWLGAQQGARVVKGAKTPNKPNTTEDTQMTPEEIQAQKDMKDAHAKSIQTLTHKNTSMKAAILLSLGVDCDNEAQFKTLEAQSVLLKQQADDGKAYRDDLIDKAVAAKRLLKEVGDDQKDVDQAKSFYSTMPLAMLKSEVSALQKRAPGQKGQVNGGDPNDTDGDGGGTGLRDKSKTAAALGTNTK